MYVCVLHTYITYLIYELTPDHIFIIKHLLYTRHSAKSETRWEADTVTFCEAHSLVHIPSKSPSQN